MHIRKLSYWPPVNGEKERSPWCETQYGLAFNKTEYINFFRNMTNIMSKTIPDGIEPYQKEFILQEAQNLGMTVANMSECEETIIRNRERGLWDSKLSDILRQFGIAEMSKAFKDLIFNDIQIIIRNLAFAYILERLTNAVFTDNIFVSRITAASTEETGRKQKKKP